VDHFEMICNGEVARSFPMGGSRDRVNVQGTLSISKSGWCVARAWSEKAEHPILDIYPYATTSPIYISVGGSPVRSPKDAAYFAAWIDRLVQSANANQDWNTAAEKATVLRQLSRARAVYGRQVQ
jgi:TolB protein